MLITIIVIGVAAAVFGRPVTRKFLTKRRLMLAEAREAEVERERTEKEKVEAFMEPQRRYFADYGIKVAPSQGTPRVADTGVLHLTHPVILRSQSEDDGYENYDAACAYRCGSVVGFREIGSLGGSGVDWLYLGRYCPACGALDLGYGETRSENGPLGRRLKGATNLFDALGPRKTENPEDVWTKLEAEQASLEERLSAVRSRRLALAEKLGKPIDGGPFRPRLLAGGKET